MPPKPVESVPARRRGGLILMLVAVTCFTTMAVAVKLLREAGLSTFEVMTWRMGPGVPVVVLEMWRTGATFRPRRPKAVIARSVFGGFAMGTYFWAIQVLTLLQHTVLHLAQPVFVAVGAPLMLRERLRGAAIVALLLALLGSALVIVPDHVLWIGVAATVVTAMPLVPGLVGLLSAAFSALAHMSVRMATARAGEGPGRGEPDAPEVVVFYFMSSVAIVCGVVGWATGGFRALPDGYSWAQTAGLIALLATTGVAGQLCMSRAYARTQAPAVAIVGYAGIPLSMVADVVLWQAPVGVSGLVGAASMFVAGILLVRAQRQPPPTPLPAG